MFENLTCFFQNYTNTFEFYLNKDLKKIEKIDPSKLLVDYLRENEYFGTKIGCGEGGCGACTVVIADYDFNRKKINYRTANSCLMPLLACHKKQVITIEGIGNPELPHSVQERLAAGNSSQCGFCTPGIVMSLYGLLKINPLPSLTDIEDAFDGNLCRCTGYRPILDSSRSFVKKNCTDHKENNCNSENKCQKNITCSNSTSINFNHFKEYDPNTDLPFPIELLETSNEKTFLLIDNGNFWLKPCNLEELLIVKSIYPNAKIISGNSEVGVEMKFKGMDYRCFIYVGDLKELKSFNINKKREIEYLEIGVNLCLTDLIENLNNIKNKNENSISYQNSLFTAFLSNLRWFASTQIRNFATLAGNISTASPISDINPILVAANATLTIASKSNGTRQVPIRNFFLGYRKIDLQPNEILLNVQIPLPRHKLEIVRAYKQAKRKDDDIAITNAGFMVSLRRSENEKKKIFKINELHLAYGGVAPTTIYLSKLNELSKDLEWGDDESFRIIEEEILKEINLSYSVPGGMPTFRRTLCVSFFKRFWLQISRDLKIENSQNNNNIDEIERDISSGFQDIGTKEIEPYIGISKPHVSALKQTTGVAKYLDDISKLSGELYAGLVLSQKAHANIIKIDPSEALCLPGVVAFISASDVPKCNNWGLIIKDEEFFATKTVHFVGQLIGLIIAETRQLAKKAAALVRIDYEVLEFTLTIEEAIEKNQLFDGYDRIIENGDPNLLLENNEDELTFEGQCRIGGQEHFYLETHGCLAIPKLEDNEIEIISSTQNPTEIQHEVAHALGIPSNRVVCKVKRLGGGFGGKEMRATLFAVTTAVAANKLKKPVRLILDRDADMLVTGTRHPFLGKYKLRITKTGYFKAYEVDLFSNAGFSYDLSRGVMDRAVTHVDNAYKFPYLRVRGRLARTNTASNTAFRGFGGPQGMMVTEMMISEIADKLGLDAEQIRFQNMYKNSDSTHYNNPIEDWYLPEMWNKILEDSKYNNQKKEIEEFNQNNIWKKRGISILPTKFGVAFGVRFLNQGAALVHIYADGSVLLTHGGVEMGQGLHTKMIQIAANTLQIPDSYIFISETATDKVPNTSPSAASVQSDLNGMAVYNACIQLYERLKPYREQNPNGNISQWANAAYFDRVNLSANGFHKTPDLDYDWNTNAGRLYSYFTNGIAISSVELDVLTGDHTILKSDIIMDIGNSINYSIDIGQIEGAFIQGVGWCTLEEVLLLSSNGSLFTRGPGNYKIPGFHDVPQKLNVQILRDKAYSHLKTIKSSKAIGEPPLFLGASVFFALREAVKSARKSNGINLNFKFPSPCTSEVLRLACGDPIVEKALVNPKIMNQNQKEVYEKLWAIRP